MRCFVALDLPDAIRRACVDTQAVLRALDPPRTRFTAPENLHLTLKFLGEQEPEAVAWAAEALARIEASPQPIRLAGVGTFARIIWVALQGAEELQRQVDQALQDRFAPERRFMGHVTIARTKGVSQALRETIHGLPVDTTATMLESFSLQESILGPSGPRYETLIRAALR